MLKGAGLSWACSRLGPQAAGGFRDEDRGGMRLRSCAGYLYTEGAKDVDKVFVLGGGCNVYGDARDARCVRGSAGAPAITARRALRRCRTAMPRSTRPRASTRSRSSRPHITERTPMLRASKIASTTLCLIGFALAAASCGKSSTAPTFSPPLPPAEEPDPGEASAYVADGGARPDEGNRPGEADD